MSLGEEMVGRVREALSGKILKEKVHNLRRIYFDVSPGDAPGAVLTIVRDLGVRFDIVTGSDTVGGFELLYHLSHDPSGIIFTVRTVIEDRQNPEIDSLGNDIPAARWIEREIWEMLGVRFRNHPNLVRLLLPEEWPEGVYPLRRDYELKKKKVADRGP
jgi:Ni,Fe-hydrogenase III component G